MRITQTIMMSLLSLGLIQSAWAKEIDHRVIASICISTKNNESASILRTTKSESIVLKRDFNQIHCKKTSEFEGGNLYQIAVHFNRLGMLDSFLDEHGLSINQLDQAGQTVLDWVDEKLNHYKKIGSPFSVDKYKKLRAELIDTYEAKTRKELDAGQ